MRVRVAGALAAAGALACAQPQTPPGGEIDRTAPRVIAVTPAMYDTLTDLRTPVVIRFDERLSERLQGVPNLADAVIVSPATGEVRAERARTEVRISVEGGWRPGLVYRVVLLPVLSDRFQNRRTEAVELVFSTGAPIPPTAMGGFIEDRLTGRPVGGARVEATRRLDEVTYVAISDSSGFFAMRHIPAGAYDIRAWLDLNRNRQVDFQEPQHQSSMALGFQDTAVVELPLLPRDTTPARLARAEAVDSLRVRLTFDDHFEPGPVGGTAAVYSLADSSLISSARLIHSTRLDSILAAERAVADSIREAEEARREIPPDSLAPRAEPDSARPPTDPRRMVQPPRAPAARTPQQPAAEPLPSRELILIMPEPLVPGASYFVVVEGVTNIQGVPGGGGSARFTAPRPPPPEPAEPPEQGPATDTVPPPEDARADTLGGTRAGGVAGGRRGRW